MRPVLLSSLIVSAALLANCASPPPPPPPPTVLNVTIKALPGVNPGPDGQPAPVALRLYQLETPAGFQDAEFFPLYNGDAVVLGQDLVKKEEIVLPPGGSKSEVIQPKDQVKSLGVFAGFRDFQHMTWRAVADVPANKTTNVTIIAGPAGVTMKAEPAPPPPPPPAKPAS